MSNVHIAESISRVVEYLSANPDEARGTGTDATATVDGLRATVANPDGTVVVTDMPKAVGGGGTAPSPGWLLRAALASCDATVIAMRAASVGVTLDVLEVTATLDFDDHGLFGMDADTPAGPLSATITVRIGASGVDRRMIEDIVQWSAEEHSPVGDALARAVPSRIVIEHVD